jgi:hypothetical protein
MDARSANNINININNNKSNIDKIYELYENLTYWDIYTNSVILFIILTIIVVMVHLYCIVMKNAKEIKDDWVNQKCNPKVMPFAGFINKPEGTTITEFTADNFNDCIQSVLINITGYAVQPFNYLTSALTSVFDSIKQSVEIIRIFLSNLRNSFANIAKDILDRLLNIMVPLEQIFIAFKATISKTEGIMTAGLYTILGTYYGLKSFLGAIVQLMIEILIMLAIVIVGLWVLPFTWPVAMTMSAVFLAVSIPLTIIVVFMTEVLHVQSEGIPRLSSCFDKDTMLKMNDGTEKTILNVEVGDILENNNTITAKMQLNSSGIKMYNINGVIVSETHILNYKDKWIPVYLHPDKAIIENYNEPYIYCLNTTTKEIRINNIVFTDWDELYGKKLDKILDLEISPSKFYNYNNNKIETKDRIHLLDKGYEKGTIVFKDQTPIPIENIKIGDAIDNNLDVSGNKDIVYGIVHIKNNNYLGNEDISLSLPLPLEFDFKKNIRSPILIHLLTYSNHFNINGEMVGDYNSLIDTHL